MIFLTSRFAWHISYTRWSNNKQAWSCIAATKAIWIL